MGLTSSLLIGKSALAASQLALQVTGNNVANVGTAGYSRQVVTFDPVSGDRQNSRLFLGRGVSVADVRRTVDPALQSRLRAGISDQTAKDVSYQLLSDIESILNELSDSDLSSELQRFFDSFSSLANSPSSSVSKAAAVEQAGALADFIRGQRSDLTSARQQVDSQLASDVKRANVLLDEVASLNLAVVEAELGGGSDPSLRDQRDALVEELATLIDVNVIERDSGSVDILVGSTPVVLGTDARGLEFERRTVDGELEVRVLVSDSQEQLNVTSGTIGARLAERDQAIDDVINRLDELASSVIYEVNRLHSSGRPSRPITSTSAWQSIPTADQALAFNDPTNETLSALTHRPTSGTFTVVITDAQGHSETTTISIDLDGISSTGAPGYADDTSLATLTASLDGIANLNATITPDGKLQLTTAQGYDVSFKNDTSGTLAVLGVNTLFHGTDSTDIAINPEFEEDPQRLVVGLSGGSNEAALAIAGLRNTGVASLGGESITARWLSAVEKNSVDVAAAETRAEAATTVKQSLEAQHASLAGVSLDEESLNLIAYQQAYQGAANFISVVNELTQVLLNLV